MDATASRRPFIFSRWGGLGNQRYPIGFSGDTHVTWASLAFQPYFTATAANVSYGWWSHDIGGHCFGTEEAELYARWVQYGVFSPIMRLHSTNNPLHDRRPWAFDAEVEHVARAALQLRHALIPYLYTLVLAQRAGGGRRRSARSTTTTRTRTAAYHCPQQNHLWQRADRRAVCRTPCDPDHAAQPAGGLAAAGRLV